jgi:hypothetical protein
MHYYGVSHYHFFTSLCYIKQNTLLERQDPIKKLQFDTSKSMECEVWLGYLMTELAENLPTSFGQEFPQRVFAKFLEILILFRPLKRIYIN